MTAPAVATFGIYGKIPANADFINRDLPRTFVSPWDQWLSESLTASRQVLGDSWVPIYLKSPPWRFAIDAGLAGPHAWIGLLLSSIDHVQRCFPLTLAVALPEAVTIAQLRVDFDPLLEQLEEIALGLVGGECALDGAMDNIGAIARQIDVRARSSPLVLRWGDGRATVRVDLPRAPPISAMVSDQRPADAVGVSCWWHRSWGHYGPVGIAALGLPPPGGFAAFLDGAWAKHGWIANG